MFHHANTISLEEDRTSRKGAKILRGALKRKKILS